jgi:hypothetical protein
MDCLLACLPRTIVQNARFSEAERTRFGQAGGVQWNCWLAKLASLFFVQHYLVCQPSTVADYGERLNKNTKKFRSGCDKHCNTWSLQCLYSKSSFLPVLAASKTNPARLHQHSSDGMHRARCRCRRHCHACCPACLAHRRLQ